MDINKEREAFEKKFPVPAHWIDFCGLTCKYICKYNAIDDQTLKYQARWESWLAAKAQAVPEGFVLVPKELSTEEARRHAEAMFNKVEHMAKYEQRDLSESEFESFKNRWLDARTLTIQFDWKAMIEAQEQKG